MAASTTKIVLRDVLPSDLDTFYEFHQDPEACRMAAFVAKNPSDRAAFDAHWAKILADPTLIKRAILCDGKLAGNLGKFEMFGLPQVTYWIGREFWGQGIATAALKTFLASYPDRPIYACVAFDNTGSQRVLEKCGFVRQEADRGYANARGCEIEEYIFRLD